MSNITTAETELMINVILRALAGLIDELSGQHVGLADAILELVDLFVGGPVVGNRADLDSAEYVLHAFHIAGHRRPQVVDGLLFHVAFIAQFDQRRLGPGNRLLPALLVHPHRLLVAQGDEDVFLEPARIANLGAQLSERMQPRAVFFHHVGQTRTALRLRERGQERRGDHCGEKASEQRDEAGADRPLSWIQHWVVRLGS
jgi:hypothetical protein